MAYDPSTVPTRLGYEPADVVSRLTKLQERKPEPSLKEVSRAVCNEYETPDPKRFVQILANTLQKVSQHQTISAQSRVRSISYKMDGYESSDIALSTAARIICGTFDTPSGKELADTLIKMLGYPTTK